MISREVLYPGSGRKGRIMNTDRDKAVELLQHYLKGKGDPAEIAEIVDCIIAAAKAAALRQEIPPTLDPESLPTPGSHLRLAPTVPTRELVQKAYDEIGSALAQVVPEDDQIIIGHVETAKKLLELALRG